MKKFIVVAFVVVLFVQCQSNQSHLIQKDQVGLITKTTKVSDLDQIFAKDSLVKPDYQPNQPKYFSEDYNVYGKKGALKLIINIENKNDSTSAIQNIQIFTNDYKTKKGVSVASLFKDLKQNYDIGKVESTITSASVYIKSLNASFIISNKALGLNEFNTGKVSVDQIPDNAQFKYITVWFN